MINTSVDPSIESPYLPGLEASLFSVGFGIPNNPPKAGAGVGFAAPFPAVSEINIMLETANLLRPEPTTHPVSLDLSHPRVWWHQTILSWFPLSRHQISKMWSRQLLEEQDL